MASAGSVTVDFDARSAKFAAELEKVQGSLRRIEGSAASLTRGLNLLASVFSVGVVLNYARAMFEAADAIGDAAARSGVAVESLSRLKFIAEQSDVEFGALTIGIKKFQQGLSEANNGTASAIKSFAAIGVEAAKIRNLPNEQQLASIAHRFRNVRNPAAQTRLAIELFGKAGQDLIPFLKLGSAGISELANEADRLGITLNAAAAGGIGAADQALKKLSATVAGFVQNRIGELALTILGTDFLSDIDKANLRLRQLLEEKQRIELSGAPEGSGFAARLVEISNEVVGLTEKLRVLQAVESYSTLSGRGGRGRPGGGGNPNSQSGIGGTFVPFKPGEGGEQGIDIGELLSPEARAQQLAEIGAIAEQARAEDYQSFLAYEFGKRQATDETYRAQLASAEIAQQTEQEMRLATANLALGLLNTLAGKSKAAAIAAVLLNRGLAISQAIQNTAVAVTRALTVDPTGALAARVATLGKIQIGIIAATGALEVANIAGGNAGGIGGTTLGTPSNPLPTTSAADAEGATGRKNVTVVFNGPVTERDALLGIIKDAFDADVVVIPPGSRQAQEIRGGA